MGAGVEWRVLLMDYMNFCFVIHIRDSVIQRCASFWGLFFLIRDLLPFVLQNQLKAINEMEERFEQLSLY
ncbi:hypothetical protein SAMN06297164_3115 [Nitrosomonas ureae]|uniref:Uncharacterized protein n=1 Tax=Nitrosomonas ureae TaxID=44577 RepID=A0A286AGL0_9PROT|nr:hypothetical protein SAMN06297164_3115 [Nitrosomonas ureae]